jgi:hypothetical protein
MLGGHNLGGGRREIAHGALFVFEIGFNAAIVV